MERKDPNKHEKETSSRALDRMIANVRFLIENGHLRPKRLPGIQMIDPRPAKPTDVRDVTTQEGTPAALRPASRVWRGLPKWAWAALLLLTLGATAHLTRYQHIPAAGEMAFWDRWSHRICVLSGGEWVCARSIQTARRQ